MPNNNIDDLPPPPYSETDIYSNPGDRVPLSPSHNRRGSYGRGDNTISPSSAPSTVDGEIIYTPPLTPHTSSQQSNSFSNYAAPPSALAESVTGNSLDHLTTTSAQAYFETRPTPAHLRNFVPPVFVHSVRVTDTSSPDDFPFPFGGPSESAARDTTPQDWQTFVNYLIPNFFAVNNERVIDRKLRAEGLSSPNRSVHGEDDNSVGGRTHVEAQLEQIRSPLPGAGTGSPTARSLGNGGLSESRRQAVEQTIREWNEGFFGLRGVNIRLASADTEDVLHVMPGGWDASFDNTGATPGEVPPAGNNTNTNNGNGAGTNRSRFARFMPQFGGGGPSSGGGARGPFGLGIPGVGASGPGSFRIGGIAVDGDRLSIGDRFVADRNGLRIGSFVADNNGISVNGQPMFGTCPNVGGTRGMCGPGNGSGHHTGWGGFGGGRGCHNGNGGPWGRGWGGRGGGRGHQGRGWGGRHGRGHPNDEEPDHDHDQDHARGQHDHRGRRGRSRRRERQDSHRSRSRSSSVSSTSSSSSSSSESSIGSLPDYDELRDSQLPVAKDHLLAWLHNPDQPITKEKLKECKQKIMEAKNASSGTGINEPVNIAHDQKALRKEVKALMKEWKDLKRQQTKVRRQLRKERRQQRRAEKRERRNTRREMKRAEREQRREQRRANRRNGNTNGCSSSASSASIPFPEGDSPHFPFPGGRVPGVPPFPGAPQSHPTFPFTGAGGPFGSRNNGGRGGGIFGPFGLFGGGGAPNSFPFQGEGVTSRGPAQAPGAWPSEHNNNNDDPITHRASQAKYKAADDLEEQLIQKETELFKLHEAIALAADADADAGSCSSRSHPASSDAPSAKTEKQRLAARDLEEEIEGLAQRMALMRTEADAEYAKELAGMTDQC
ncbi:hypothetical protein V8F20_002058 [Naviculisporaceae sp. PSN 640]